MKSRSRRSLVTRGSTRVAMSSSGMCFESRDGCDETGSLETLPENLRLELPVVARASQTPVGNLTGDGVCTTCGGIETSTGLTL